MKDSKKKPLISIKEIASVKKPIERKQTKLIPIIKIPHGYYSIVDDKGQTVCRFVVG